MNDAHIQRLNSLSQMAASTSLILAPALGVVLYNWLGFDAFILFSLGSNVISLLILLSMKFYAVERETTNEDQAANDLLTKFKAALHYIYNLRLIKDTILIAVLFNFFYSSLVVGIPYIIKVQLNLGNSMIGILDTSTAVGMLCGGLLCNFIPSSISYKNKITWPLLSTTLAFITLELLFSVAPGYWKLAILGAGLMFIFSVGLSVINIFIAVFLQENVKSGMLGRVTSIMYTSCTAIMPVGILIFTVTFKWVIDGGLVLLISVGLLGLCLLLMMPRFIKALGND